MEKNFIRILFLAAALATGCGGGGGEGTTAGGGGGSGSSGGEGGGGSAATDSSGEVITDTSGRAVSVQAHRAWQDGSEKFAEYERTGWNEGRCREVDRLFDRANDEQGGHMAEAMYMRGLVQRRCGGDGRRYFEQALSENPRYCNARVATGMLSLEAGNRAEARQRFQAALDADENCMPAYANIALLQAENPSQVNDALISLSSALALDSDFMPAFNEMALIYFRTGVRTHDSGMVDLAHIVCEQATMIDGNYAPIYNTWGLIRLYREDINEALRFFLRARQLDNTIYEAQINFGNITFQFRGYQDAYEAYNRAAELQPRSYDAAVGLGAALRGLQRYDEAKAQFERAIQIDGNRPEAYFNLGQLYQSYMSGSVDDLNRAKQYYQTFLQKAGNNAAFAATVQETTRTCQAARRRSGSSRRGRGMGSSCRPGYVQLIDQTIQALQAQAEIERMNRENGGGGEETPPQ